MARYTLPLRRRLPGDLLRADERLTFLGHAATVAPIFTVLAAALPAA